MSDKDYIIGIVEVNDTKLFFKSLLAFYAPIDVILSHQLAAHFGGDEHLQ